MIKEVNDPQDCPFRVSDEYALFYCNIQTDVDCSYKISRSCPLLKEDITVMFVSIKKK